MFHDGFCGSVGANLTEILHMKRFLFIVHLVLKMGYVALKGNSPGQK